MKKVLVTSFAITAFGLMSFTSTSSSFFEQIFADKGITMEQEVILDNSDIMKYSGSLNAFIDEVRKAGLSYNINGEVNSEAPTTSEGAEIDITIKVCPGTGEKCLLVTKKDKDSDAIEIEINL